MDGSAGESNVSVFNNERFAFYLERRDLIRTWASIEGDIRNAVAEFLPSMYGAIDGRLRTPDGSVEVAQTVVGERNIAAVGFRPNWRLAAEDPDVGIGLGWDSKVWPTGPSAPYVGVIAAHFSDRGKAIDSALRPIVRARLAKEKSLYVNGYYWVTYRYVLARPDWWEKPDEWEQSLVEATAEAWKLWEPTVDGVVQSMAMTPIT